MNWMLLMALLVVSLNAESQEPPPVNRGDQVRVWRAWPFNYWEEGTVVSLSADTLVMERANYQSILVLPLESLEKFEIRRGRGVTGRHWEPVPVVNTVLVAKSKPKIRVNIGLTVIGIGGGIGLTYQTGKHLMSIRATRVYERFVWDWDKAWEAKGDIDSPGEQSWDVGILYGRTKKLEYVSVVFSGGLGFAGGIRRGEYLAYKPRRGNIYEKRVLRTAGIPIELQLVRAFSEDVGLGLYGYGNLNGEASFAGLLLFLQGR